jgi:membrane-associated phospholipid phosphatase
MIRSILVYLERHGFQIMMAGFVLVALCALAYTGCIIAHRATHHLKNIAYSWALAGLIVYALGRLLMQSDQRRRKRTEKLATNDNKERT